MVSPAWRGQNRAMYQNFPVAPKQPRRVHSGQRAPIGDHQAVPAGAHRTPSGRRRPIGPVTPDETEARPGTRRRTTPAYAKRRSS
jgi:hypothetical protein